MKDKTNSSNLIILTIVFVAIFIAAIMGFYLSLRNESRDFVESSIGELAGYSERILAYKIDTYKSGINAIAEHYYDQKKQVSNISTPHSEYKELARIFGFNELLEATVGSESVTILNKDGETYQSWDDSEVFEKLFSSSSIASSIRHDKNSGECSVIIGVPLLEDGKVKGALVGVAGGEFLESILLRKPAMGSYYTVFVDNNVNVIISNVQKGNTISELFGKDIKSEVISKVSKDFTNGQSGGFYYKLDGRKFYAAYIPTVINGFNIIHTSSFDDASRQVQVISNHAILLLVIIMICFGVLIYIVTAVNKQNNLKVVASEEKYRIAMEFSDIIVFEHNLIDDSFNFSENFQAFYGELPPIKDFPQSMLDMGLIYIEDVETFWEHFNRSKEYTELTSYEIRIRTILRGYEWCRVELQPIIESGVPLRIVGRIINIHKEKTEKETLTMRINSDPLTGLYNRMATQSLINQILKKSLGHTLLLIDIDNFKNLNDNLGYIFGDTVLTESASQLKKILRNSGVIGRIGGDEFVIMLENVTDKSAISNIAMKICDIFRRIFAGDKHECKVSCSIGITICDEPNMDFQTLYSKASAALNYSKIAGKDTFTFYDENLTKPTLLSTPTDTVNGQDNVVARSNFYEDIRGYILNLLYRAKDIKVTINLILELLGKHFDVSRVYIFEFGEFEGSVSNTYEWCNLNIAPEKEHLQNVFLKEVNNFFEYYDEDSVFACDDIKQLKNDLSKFLEKQGILSILHVGIEDADQLVGFIGFDECLNKRDWTKYEIEILTFVGHLIGSFIMKNNFSNEIVKAYNNQRVMLDGMQNYTYVINDDNYELLYINRTAKERVPTAEISQTCYSAFHGGQNQLCENCPVAELRQSGESKAKEVYSPYLDAWGMIAASYIPWTGVNGAILVNCIDITEYKNAHKVENKDSENIEADRDMNVDTDTVKN